MDNACGHGRIYSTTSLEDYTLPAEMRNLEITHCAQMFGSLVDARVETQSGARGVCAIRIGPSLATTNVDASSLASLFEDKQLGARVGAAIRPASPTPARNVIVMVDRFRVALSQTETTRGLLFYLVVDGCLHAPVDSPDGSSVR